MFYTLYLILCIPFVTSQISSSFKRQTCPVNWVKSDLYSTMGRDVFNCYKFVRSPKKSYAEAKLLCETYEANVLSINTNEEHGFVVRYLHENDPLYRTWYIGIVQKSGDYWETEDGTPLLDSLRDVFLPGQTLMSEKRYLAYSYSYETKQWGFLMTDGRTPSEFICEIPSNRLGSLVLDAEEDRDYEYGIVVQDPLKLRRAPKIIKQPDNAMFDILKRDVFDYISISCFADGYPSPTYNWYKEEYNASVIQAKKVNPLRDERFTVSGGTLIINRPDPITDRGQYYCAAENELGIVVSESVQLSFAYMSEFNLVRSSENGNQNWGKAIYCDPPQFFPDARFYWSRDYFPNFVDEDKRTFVSFDGNLYFSYLDNIDAGSYICTVQSTVSDIGRHGPKFNLDVLPHPNYQQLKFANNFPKAFPNSPVRGNQVRLECIAFGYPVSAYNWTRRNAPLPRGSQLANYNRVLILPNVEPSDMGEYVCRAQNNRLAIEGSIMLSILANPKFTIALKDLFIAEGEDVLMECEAFAIPDVTYSWLRNAKPLVIEELQPSHMRPRYEINDNVLRIRGVTSDDEATYQCKATNQLSSSFSSSELRVLKLAPTFIKNPLEPEMYAAGGTNITIQCRPEAAPAPDFEWRKDGLRIGRGGRLDISRNGDLTIEMVSWEDRGNYNCTATNAHGSDSSGGRLIVLDQPYFLEHPQEEIYAIVGDDLFLICEARMDSILDLTYVWMFNEMRIQVDTDKTDIYYIDDQTYNYDFYTRRRMGDKIAGRKALQTELEYVSRREPPYQRGYKPGQLRIRNLTLEDSGFYMCDAKSPIANISFTTKITVFGPPGPPGGITALAMTSTKARVRWTNGATNGRFIRSYAIQGKTIYNEHWKTLAQNVTARVIHEQRSRMEYELPEGVLTPYASYRFRVMGINSLGEGQYSAPSPTANTRQDIPFKAPDDVGGGGGKTGDLTITWTPLSREEQNAPDDYYIVYWRRYVEGTRDDDPFKKIILKNRGKVNMFVATIEPRYFYTKYEVRVQSANRLGLGPVSETVLVDSAEDMPQVQPTEVKAFGFNATALEITWRPIEPTRDNIRGNLIGYRLKYWREKDNETNAQIRLKLGTEPRGLVVGLVPNTFYWVRVMAYNSAGSGPESEKFRERTWRYPPLTPPNAVEVEKIDPENVNVRWRGVTPTELEEALLGYKVRVWEADQDMTTATDTLIPLGAHLETQIGGLELGKIYKLRVLAYSLGGDGKMSSPPWHFSMGDPEKLVGSAMGLGPAASTLLIMYMYIHTYF